MRRLAFVSAPLAPSALIAGWTIAAARQPHDFSSLRETISALAAHGATEPWIMTTGLAALGASHVVTGACLVEAGTAARALLMIGGSATIAVAALPQPAAGHVPAAAVGFVSLAAWPLVSRVPRRPWAVGAGALLIGTLAWLLAELRGGDLLGLAERVVAGAEAIWPLAVVTALAVPRWRRAAS